MSKRKLRWTLREIAVNVAWYLLWVVFVPMIAFNKIWDAVFPTAKSAEHLRIWCTNTWLESGYDCVNEKTARQHRLNELLGHSHWWTRLNSLVGDRLTIKLARI